MIPVFCGSATEHWVAELNQHSPTDLYTTSDSIADAPVAVFTAPQASQLNSLPSLKWAHCTYAGVEKALAETQHPIARLIDPRLSNRMAQSSLTACLDYCQNRAHYRIQQAQTLWHPLDQKQPSQVQVLILGAGAIASVCAETLRTQGFKVATFSRRAKALPWPHFSVLSPEIIAGAQIVINLLPDTEQTRGIINEAFLEALRDDRLLVNFGRGSAIDVDALARWLDGSSSHHALLDVFDVEPLPDDSLLWGHPQVEIWPHVSATTDIKSAARIIHKNIQAYLDTGQLPPLVDRARGY